jgi:hypothetical protein
VQVVNIHGSVYSNKQSALMHENVSLDVSVEIISSNDPVRFQLNVHYYKYKDIKEEDN